MNPEAGTPRWVKVFIAVSLVVAVVVLVVLVAAPGGHSPGRHGDGDGVAALSPPRSTA